MVFVGSNPRLLNDAATIVDSLALELDASQKKLADLVALAKRRASSQAYGRLIELATQVGASADAARTGLETLRTQAFQQGQKSSGAQAQASMSRSASAQESSTAGRYRIGAPTPPILHYDDGFPRNPNAQPTAGDYASWAKWQSKLRGAQVLRPDLDDATEVYANYMSGSGRQMELDYEEAYREDENVRKSIDSEIETAKLEIERLYFETGQTRFEFNSGHTPATHYPSTENWQKTIGAHFLWADGKAAIDGDRITMKIHVNFEDMYDFNPNENDVKTGAPDNENGRFKELGWADRFRTFGRVERTVTWTLSAPEGGSTGGAPSPAGGGRRQ